MKHPKLCGRRFDESIANPFDQVLCLDFYDGPISGLARCKESDLAYAFEMIAWDDEQDNRIYSLAEVDAQVFDAVAEIFYGKTKPTSSFWCPRYEEGKNAAANKAMANIPEPKYVVASHSIDRNIDAIREIDASARSRLTRPKAAGTARVDYPTPEDWAFWHPYVAS